MANNIIKRIWNQNTLVNIEVLKGAFFQDEDGGHTFEISGVDNSGNAISLSGTVAGVFLRPDNTDVPITGSASGGIVSVTLPAECYDVPGRFGLTVFVTADSMKTCVYAAIGTVGRTSSGSVAPGTSADVVDLINQISAAVATIPASWSGLMADIAPTYSTSAAYPVGAYVYYNGDLYRCTTAITSGETWTAAHWTTAVLGNDVSDLKNAFAQYNNASDHFGDEVFEKGSIDATTGDNSTYRKNARARTKVITDATFDFTIRPFNTAMTDFKVMVYLYNTDDSYKSASGWVAEGSSYSIRRGDRYRLLIYDSTRTSSSSSIDLDELVSHIRVISDDFFHIYRLDSDNLIKISENADLNDLDIGSYVCQTAEIAETLTNCPVTTNFRLTISHNQASSRKFYWLVNGLGHIWSRIQSSNGYYDWKEVSAENKISLLMDEISMLKEEDNAVKACVGYIGNLNGDDFENGSLDTSGENATYHAFARVRSKSWVFSTYNFNLAPEVNYELLAYYDDSGTVTSSGWIASDGTGLLIKSGVKYRLLLRDSTRDTSSDSISVSEMLSHFSARYVGDIVEKNSECAGYFASLKRHMENLSGGSTSRRLNHNNCFTVAHISDVHLDQDRYKNYIKFCDIYGNYIDERICTGDFINEPFDAQIAYMRDIEATKTVLWCDGNHERNGGVPLYEGGPNGLTRAEVYQKWGLAQWYTDTGVTPGTGDDNPLYYYKDFVDSNSVSGYKIRLIVTNCCDYRGSTSTSSLLPRYTTAQMSWLVGVLQDAADNGFAVILAQHYPESSIIAGDNTSFYNRTNMDEAEIPDIPVIENIIDAFRNGTTYTATNIKMGSTDDVTLSVSADFTNHSGQFLAWMAGHRHRDRIGYSARHPDQLILQVVDGCLHRTDGESYSDMTNDSDLPRVEGEKSEDAFNVYAFDPVNKLCKVLRVGSDMNDMMIPRKYACFDTEPLIT